MGLLDDAIRDHLELKRRSGADPGEVARIENEALSAARREAPPAAAGVGEADPQDDELFDGDVEDDPLADLPYRDAEPDDEYEPVAEAPVHQHEPEPEAVYEHELLDVEPEPEPEPPAAMRALEPVAEEPEDDPQATQQYSLEELEAQAARDAAAPGQPRPRTAEPADGEPGEEDVLEETPEFLQETPEHDRLWFEQKPPKDFDF
jgi:hypothetical protein